MIIITMIIVMIIIVIEKINWSNIKQYDSDDNNNNEDGYNIN